MSGWESISERPSVGARVCVCVCVSSTGRGSRDSRARATLFDWSQSGLPDLPPHAAERAAVRAGPRSPSQRTSRANSVFCLIRNHRWFWAAAGL